MRPPRSPQCRPYAPALLTASVATVMAAALTSCAHPAAHTPPAAADRTRVPVQRPSAPTAPAVPSAPTVPDPSAASPAGDANRPHPYADPAASTPPAFPPPTGKAEAAKGTKGAVASAAPSRTGAPPPATTAARPGPNPSRGAPAAPKKAAAERQYPPGTTVLRIGDWSRPVVRGDQATIDACGAAVLFAGPDPALSDGYEMRTSVIVGHDYCGYDKLAPLPVGTRVTLDTPRGTLSFHVYATYVNPGRGGPDNGLYWGDLTLQTCVGPDTGFSYLTRD
ncbi:hypothetical protein ACIO6U_34000 [Streptomyces sp. NPDC087422]|uniref:hypothetical protein n=1 Tax=Streptomyces sp. NPDC087422 TaxID=3365786 RepID=UPI00380133BF